MHPCIGFIALEVAREQLRIFISEAHLLCGKCDKAEVLAPVQILVPREVAICHLHIAGGLRCKADVSVGPAEFTGPNSPSLTEPTLQALDQASSSRSTCSQALAALPISSVIGACRTLGHSGTAELAQRDCMRDAGQVVSARPSARDAQEVCFLHRAAMSLTT